MSGVTRYTNTITIAKSFCLNEHKINSKRLKNICLYSIYGVILTFTHNDILYTLRSLNL